MHRINWDYSLKVIKVLFQYAKIESDGAKRSHGSSELEKTALMPFLEHSLVFIMNNYFLYFSQIIFHFYLQYDTLNKNRFSALLISTPSIVWNILHSGTTLSSGIQIKWKPKNLPRLLSETIEVTILVEYLVEVAAITNPDPVNFLSIVRATIL